MKYHGRGNISLVALALMVIAISAQWRKAHGANILGLFTSHSPSHLIVHMSVMKALAEQGHNVTVVCPYKPSVTHRNIRHIIIPPTEADQTLLSAQVTEMASKKNGILTIIKNLFGPMVRMQIDILKDARFQSFYETPNTNFDLVIIGWFMNDFLLGVAARYKCPIIIDWSGQPMEITDLYVGNPSEIAYVPNQQMQVKTGVPMDFRQRLINVFSHAVTRTVKTIHDYRMNKVYEQLYPRDNMPTYAEMQKNVSLVFCNHHFSEGPIRPYVPAIIEIGGIQIKDTPDSLPVDIAAFLNASEKHGAILFSLGSNVQCSDIKPETVDIIYKTLASLKQHVIWKWENLNKTPGSSKNILYKKWLPQDDILAHPNLKLFITHAGKGGVVEAQYHGVPMVALPIFGDQPQNAAKMASAGYGFQLDLQAFTEAAFKNAITEVLANPVYANNIKTFSQLYRDRPMTARQTVVYWAEYVIRHHGAAHIQSPLLHMNVIQSSNLDVIVFLSLIIYALWRVSKIGIQFVWRKIFKGPSKKHSYKKVKNQ